MRASHPTFRKPTLLLLLCAACGTETGNPEGMVVLAYDATSSDLARASFEAGSRAQVDGVWLRLEQTTVAVCDDDDQRFPGIGLGDHAGPEPAFQTLDGLPDAPACGLSIAAAPADGAGDPEGVDGAAAAVLGRLGDGRPFVVRWDEPVDLGVALDAQPLPVDGGWLLTFDVATWLDVDALEADPADSITLTGDPARLTDGLGLVEDLDGDGLIDAGEGRLDAP